MNDSVTYQAVLPCRRETVAFVAQLLAAERLRRATRTGRRALDCFAQAVLVLRWYLDGTRVRQLARDNSISKSTCYGYLHEGLCVLARRLPTLRGALIAALAAGYSLKGATSRIVCTPAGHRRRARARGFPCGRRRAAGRRRAGLPV